MTCRTLANAMALCREISHTLKSEGSCWDGCSPAAAAAWPQHWQAGNRHSSGSIRVVVAAAVAVMMKIP